MNKKKLFNNNKLIKNKIKNLSRNKDNNNNLGKNSFLIYKTEYSENNMNKKGENKNKDIKYILNNKSFNHIRINKKINNSNNNKIK